MNDPMLEEVQRRIRAQTTALFDELELPLDAPGVRDLSLEDDILTLTVDPTSLDDQTLGRLADGVRGIGLGTPGVDHVRIASETEDVDGSIHPTGVSTLVAIGGAKGGVGRTTLTAAIALRLADRGLGVGLFDCDVDAGDLPRYLDIDEPVRSTPDGRPSPVWWEDVQVMSVDLVAGDRPVVWRGAMIHDVLVDLLGRASWDDRDVVLLDLPPGIGDAVYTAVQDVALAGAIVVSTHHPLAEAGAQRARSLFEANEVPVLAEAINVATVFDDVDDREEIVVPYDAALSAGDLSALSPETVDALDRIAAAIEAAIPATDHTPDDILDLRGLPRHVAEQQVVLELGDAPAPPTGLLVDDEASILGLLESAFEGAVVEPAVDTDQRPILRVL